METDFIARGPRSVCSIIGGLAGVPLGGIEGISISSGGAPPQVPVTTKIEIFQSPAPPPPPPPPTPPAEQFGGFDVSGTLGGLAGGIIAQILDPFSVPTNPPPAPVPPLRSQPGEPPQQPPPQIRMQPFEVPTLDFGFRPQTGELQTTTETLDQGGREFRPREDFETTVQTLQQTGQGGQQGEIQRTGTQTGGQQTLQTIEQSRADFQSGHFVDPPGELDFIAPARSASDHPAQQSPTPCATCSMLNSDPNATDSFPVEMIFHFRNHASAQRLGGLCEADGECEIA